MHFAGDKNTDNTGDFYVSAFKDQNGGQSSQYIGSEKPVQMPRKTGCERGQGGYTVNGLGGAWANSSPFHTIPHSDEVLFADHDGQAVIVLCPSQFNSPSPGIDQRAVTDIKSQGLQSGKSALEKLWPLSKTILHEFCHTKPVCGSKSLLVFQAGKTR